MTCRHIEYESLWAWRKTPIFAYVPQDANVISGELRSVSEARRRAEITTKIAYTQIFGYFSPNNMKFYAETIVGTIIVHQNP